MLMLAYEGEEGVIVLAYVSIFTKRYFKFSRIFCHSLYNWRMKFRLTKFSHYDVYCTYKSAKLSTKTASLERKVHCQECL